MSKKQHKKTEFANKLDIIEQIWVKMSKIEQIWVKMSKID